MSWRMSVTIYKWTWTFVSPVVLCIPNPDILIAVTTSRHGHLSHLIMVIMNTKSGHIDCSDYRWTWTLVSWIPNLDILIAVTTDEHGLLAHLILVIFSGNEARLYYAYQIRKYWLLVLIMSFDNIARKWAVTILGWVILYSYIGYIDHVLLVGFTQYGKLWPILVPRLRIINMPK